MKHSLPNYLVLEGNIGAGKTTVSALLAQATNSKLVLETFDNNPFLPAFYADKARHALPVELFFLAERFNQLKDIEVQPSLFPQSTVADYFFGKSLVFAKNNLTPNEWNLFYRLYTIMINQLPVPNLIIYLFVETEKLLENIAKRGRDYEKHIDNEYLNNIQQAYFHYLRERKDLSVVCVNTTSVDFTTNKKAVEQLLKIAESHWPTGISYSELL